jgi:hypothetical protein
VFDRGGTAPNVAMKDHQHWFLGEHHAGASNERIQMAGIGR